MTANTTPQGAPSLPELCQHLQDMCSGQMYDEITEYATAHGRACYEASLRARAAQGEPVGWRSALKFYAEKSHFMLSNEDAWDTVSGEPSNFWCDEEGTATVEDGTVAARALRGTPLPDDEDAAPAPLVAATVPPVAAEPSERKSLELIQRILVRLEDSPKSAVSNIKDVVNEALATTPQPAEPAVSEIAEKLQDPVAVHVAMLRGQIAKPAIRDMLHVYGAEALAQFDRGAASAGAASLAVGWQYKGPNTRNEWWHADAEMADWASSQPDYEVRALGVIGSGASLAVPEDTRLLDWIEQKVCDVSRLGDSARTLRISWNNGADSVFVGPGYSATWREAIRIAAAPSQPTAEEREVRS